MKIHKFVSQFSVAPLIIILLVSFLIRIYNLNYNSPFLDEAIYLVLGKKLLAGHWQEAAPFGWVGGMPLFYPRLSAMFGIFGIIGARFLSVVLGTFSVYLMYEFARRLKLSQETRPNELVGLSAAALLGILASPVFLSRLAIYDMLSYTLLLLGLVFLQSGLNLINPEIYQRENRYFLASAAFFLSFLAKYVTLAFIPVAVFWGLYNTKRSGKQELFTILKYFAAPLVIAITIYGAWYFVDLRHFLAEQVSEKQNISREILIEFYRYTFYTFLLSVPGIVFLTLRKQTISAFWLLTSSLILPLVHLASNSTKAIYQHSLISLVFLLPLAGYFFAKLFEKKSLLEYGLVFAVITALFIYSQGQVRELETSWPNTYAVMQHLRERTTNHERILTFEGDVTVWSLPNIKEEQISNTFYFSYKDLLNELAYQKAMEESYFDYILYNEDFSGRISDAVKNSLTNHYELTYNTHPFLVYKLKENKSI